MANKKYTDTITLNFNHSMLAGNVNPIFGLDKLVEAINAEKRTQAVESFGFFDSSCPNYTTYYPEVKPEDLAATKEDEFIYPLFRGLSEVIVHKGWNPVDFSKDGVLKESIKLLIGQSIKPDHETGVGNSMGAVLEAVWEESYTMSDMGVKIKVPAGINVRLKLDGKANPRIARQILMDPPGINSVSVTVQFEWEQSHPDMAIETFYSKLGSYDDKGVMITRVATKIIRYKEISLVDGGADPYAKLIKDGKIVQGLNAKNTYEMLSEQQKKEQSLFVFDFKDLIVYNAEQPTIPKETKDNESTIKNKDMDELLKEFNTLMGLSATDTKETAIAKMTALVANQKTEADKIELTRLQGIETTYNENKDKITQVESLTTFQTTRLTEKRAEVTRLATLLNATPEKSVTDMIALASYEVLAGLETTYLAQVEKDIPLTCSECKSTKVNRASNGNSGETVDLTEADKMQKLRRKHGQTVLANREEPTKKD